MIFFLANNKTPDISASLLWETLKAYIPGEIISYMKYERKIRKENLSNLTSRISQLYALYAISPSPQLYKERLILQLKFDDSTHH